jgi:hypothetical protein
MVTTCLLIPARWRLRQEDQEFWVPELRPCLKITKKKKAKRQWLIPTILTTLEDEIGRI